MAAAALVGHEGWSGSAVTDRDQFGGICLCDEDGKLHWARDGDVEVVSVDNHLPKSLLDPESYP